MGVLIANEKPLELKAMPGLEKILVKDVFEGIEGATAYAGRAKAEKEVSYLFELPVDDFFYIINGSIKCEVEGKTLVAREGDFVHFQKGTKANIIFDEGCEFIFITIPRYQLPDNNL